MFKYFKMKKIENEMKYQFYSALKTFVDEKQDILALVQRLYVELKDVPMEELKREVVSQIATLAHNEAIKQRELEKTAEYNVKNQ